MQQNILGADYFLLMFFLWLVAGADYQLCNSSLLIKVGKKTPVKVVLLRLAFFVLWFMAAFRGLDVTNDIESYFRFYDKVATFGPDSVNRIEAGYLLLNIFVSKIITNHFVGFRVLILFTTIVGYSAVEQWIERHSKSYGICLLAYYYLVDSTFMSANRQMFATGIVLWALMYLEKSKINAKKYIYILMVLLASAFHQSAIICFLFLLLERLKFTRNTSLWMIIATVLATGTNIVNRVVTIIGIGTGYLTAEIGNLTNVVVNVVLYVALLSLAAFTKNEGELKNNNEITGFSENFYAYCIALTLAVTIMSLRAPGMSRMAMYLQIVGLPYISNTMKKIEQSKAQFIIKVCFGLSIWAYSAITLIYRPEWQHLWPYHFFWN